MRYFLLMIGGLALLSCTLDLRATPPEQFQVWGSVAPQSPPVPEGWTEVRDPFRLFPALQPTVEEQQRGFAVATCEPLTLVPSYAASLPQERTEELKLLAARGQYEPTTFLIYAVDALDDMLFKQLVDLSEHGCGIEPALSVEIQSRDQDFGDDDVAATQAHCRRMIAAEKRVFGAWRHPVTFEVGHQIAYYWDARKNWFSHWPHSAKIDHDLLRAVDVVRDLAKAEGWPPLRVYAMDEAGAHNLLDEARYYYGLLKKERPDLITWTDIGGGMAMGVDEISPLNEIVDILNTNRFTPEIARALAEVRAT